jgi:hypothetical protein
MFLSFCSTSHDQHGHQPWVGDSLVLSVVFPGTTWQIAQLIELLILWLCGGGGMGGYGGDFGDHVLQKIGCMSVLSISTSGGHFGYGQLWWQWHLFWEC